MSLRNLWRRGRRLLVPARPVPLLSADDRRMLLNRYAAASPVPSLSHATVRDYCDSADHLPALCRSDGDLKNVQRPWALKTILGVLEPGSELLEIGAGLPEVAALLAELGYRVTVVDPYEGEANGPTEFPAIARAYPRVSFRRMRFGADAAGFAAASFDGVYSISVLEHLSPDSVGDVFAGIRRVLRRSGASLHCVDHVVEGDGAAWHEQIVRRVVREQGILAGSGADADREYDDLMGRTRADLETFYLSPLGHHQWRCGRSYEEFPFRKVVSVQLVGRFESL